MTAQELKNCITEEDIRKLLLIMGATFYYEDNKVWITDTICHHGEKPKLYFYKESKMFHCYTECGQMDIISVVMKHNDYSKEEFQKAINWICIKLNLNTYGGFFGITEKMNDWDFIKQYSNRFYRKNAVLKDLTLYNENILNIFQRIYHKSWIDEGISVSTMEKYNILYSTWQQKIIIPHYDRNDNLIGIRTRALIENEIELFGKYAPLKVGKNLYNHPLGQNLYGLNKNIEAIKSKQKIMIVEAEKSVLQTDSMFGCNNFTVALCGSNMSDFQRDLILDLGVREVIVAMDKQYNSTDSDECRKWAKHIKENIINKLSSFVVVSVLWDVTDLLGYKDSPTDKGKETLLKLMENKIYVETNQ